MAALGLVVGVDRAFFSRQARHPWPPEPCVVQGVEARCGTFAVPDDRRRPGGRTIRLDVVVLPASLGPARPDAVAYLAGGPGEAATERAADLRAQLGVLNLYRDVLLVDQRGAAGSFPDGGDPTRYGTRMAMDDLDAVRAALGYRRLDLIGSSYGATAAQVYLSLHPASVRTLVLSGGTAIDVPFFGRHAVNAQRALDGLPELCAADAACRDAFPARERRFGRLVDEWNARPAGGVSGDELAAVVHGLLLDLEDAVSIPLLVGRAAAGDLGPLERARGRPRRRPRPDGRVDLVQRAVEGLDASGPSGTDFDGYATALIDGFRRECASVPRRPEPRALWTLPVASPVPVLALVGGADRRTRSRTSAT